MTISAIAVFLPSELTEGTHYPKGSGIREGLLAAAKNAAKLLGLGKVIEIIAPTEADEQGLASLYDNLSSLPRGTLLLTFWFDLYAVILAKILWERQEEGEVTLFFNQPWVRGRCNLFGELGNYLRYSIGYPDGDDFQSLPGYADRTFLPELAPWQQPDPAKKPVLFGPTLPAAQFHGYDTLKEWVDEIVQTYGLTDYILSFHPKALATLPEEYAARNMKSADALPLASIAYTLQSGAGFDALRAGVPVIADKAYHPIGTYMDDLALENHPQDLDRLDLFQSVAPTDLPANNTSIVDLIVKASQAKSLTELT